MTFGGSVEGREGARRLGPEGEEWNSGDVTDGRRRDNDSDKVP